MQSIPVDQICSSIYGENVVKSSNTGKSDNPASHELGHSLVFFHTDDIGSLMYHRYIYPDDVRLSQKDINSMPSRPSMVSTKKSTLHKQLLVYICISNKQLLAVFSKTEPSFKVFLC